MEFELRSNLFVDKTSLADMEATGREFLRKQVGITRHIKLDEVTPSVCKYFLNTPSYSRS